MDEAATNNHHCLCYKYKDAEKKSWDFGPHNHATIPALDNPITGTIEGGGSIVIATDGKCED